ncbi:MAG: hydroxymethylglutaryl-CoA lyase [Acidimicrobiia bacterium]
MERHVEIVEVGPRDGLQNESTILTSDQKLQLIEHLVGAGLRRIEVVSFAHPERVPQMADAEAVMEGVIRSADVSYIGLVMNWRGWMRAVDAGMDEVNIPLFATDTFNVRNQGVPTESSIDLVGNVVEDAQAKGIAVSATLGVAWGCPFEGEVSADTVHGLVERVSSLGVDELALADTIGVADPWSVETQLAGALTSTSGVPLRVHFHNTRNTGLANAYAAIQAGVTVVDASVGGIGGCPFAPAATGNIPTDDLVYMLDRGGLDHGVNIERLIVTSEELAEDLGEEVPAMLPKAGDFPAGLGSRSS